MKPSKKEQEHLITCSDQIVLQEGENGVVTSTIEVLREGVLRDRDLNITQGMLTDMVRNFRDNCYGTELQIDYGHNRGGEAAGWFKDLFIYGKSLRAIIEWTKPAVDKIRDKIWKFVSAEIAWTYPHHETGDPVSNVLIGAGLTNTPALKGQAPLQLNEEEDQLIHLKAMYKKYIEDLKGRTKLSEADIAFARKLSEDLPDSEQAAAKTEIDALEEKRAANAAKEAETLAQAGKDNVSRAEFTQLQQENADLRLKTEKTELSQTFSNALMLSQTVKTGFKEESREAVVSFMQKLNAEQRTAFLELMKAVVHVDLSTIGGRGAPVEKEGELKEGTEAFAEALVTLSEQLLAEKKAKDVDEAQRMAREQLLAKAGK